jgi:hypothetical protein
MGGVIMANVRKEFDSYKVQYTSSKRNIPLASISCFKGTQWVGLISFEKDAAALREPYLWGDKIRLFYTIDRFDDVIALLQKEEPLDLYLNPSGKWGSILTKEFEPVGEEEG